MCTESYSNDLHLKFSGLTAVGIDSVLIAGFLRLGTVEIWGQDIVCGRAVPCSVRCLLAFLVSTNEIPAALPTPRCYKPQTSPLLPRVPQAEAGGHNSPQFRTSLILRFLSWHFYFY